MNEIVARIETPPGARRPFTAGLVVVDNVVTETAPILRYMLGWSRDRVRRHCERSGWSVEVVTLNGRRMSRSMNENPRQRVASGGGRGIQEWLDEDRADEALAHEIAS